MDALADSLVQLVSAKINSRNRNKTEEDPWSPTTGVYPKDTIKGEVGVCLRVIIELPNGMLLGYPRGIAWGYPIIIV